MMSLRTLGIGLGLIGAVYGAAFVVRANSDNVGNPPAVTSVPAGDLLTQSAAPTSVRRPRDASPVPFDPVFSTSTATTPTIAIPAPMADLLDPFASSMPVPVASDVELPADAAAVDPAPLRIALRRLLDEKLDLLTASQLQTEILLTECEIREIKALDRFEHLRHELDNLSREYPQTWGGNAAQRLFQVPLPTGPTMNTPFAPPGTVVPQWSDGFLQDAPKFVPASPTPTTRRKT